VSAPSLLTIARRALTGETKLERGSTLLVAVSGGIDSMALLHVAAKLAPRLGLVIRAHGVDHGLRAAASRELDKAASLAEQLDVGFARTTVRVARGGNLQARARDARYEALAIAAERAGARAIATAHHADDRAETFLLRLLRGAGPSGLAVLPPRAPLPLARSERASGIAIDLLRPLLRARRSDIRAHVARHQIAYSDDPSNADPRFARSRVRSELLPLLEELSPGIVSHLEALSDQLLARDHDTLPLPRATLRALAELLRSGSRKTRVWLPGGLVVSAEDPRSAVKKATRRPVNEMSPSPDVKTT
jgi:tRNA(Ile)-lysidine synthase